MRNMDLKRTSPVNFVTSPTKPSQLSLGMFTRLTLSSRLATAGELIAGLFLFFCNVMIEVTPGIDATSPAAAARRGERRNPDERTKTLLQKLDVTIRLLLRDIARYK